MRQTKRALLWFLVVLLALAFVTPVLAKGPAGQMGEFEGFWFPSMFGSPDKIWFPGQQTIQSRGRWQGMRVFADDERIQGDWVFYFDEHMNRDYAGHWNGEFHAEIVTSEGSGTWDGHFHGECYGLWDGSGSVIYANGKGSGVLDGLKVQMELVEQSDGTTVIAGEIK